MTTTQVPYRLALSEEFLSGNVRLKLNAARAAAALDPTFEPSLKALQEHQPPTVSLSDIEIIPGAWWIPIQDYAAFCEEVLGVWVDISRSDTTSYWHLEPLGGTESLANTQTYGLSWEDLTFAGNIKVKSLEGYQLFEKLLNGKTPEIRVRKYEGGSTVKDPVLTLSAYEKQIQLKHRFVQWCKEDDARAKRLENLYNFQCNNLRLRSYDGSHLELTNMAQQWVERVRQRPYQLNGIYRGICGQTVEDVLCGLGLFWEVGLGKSIASIAIANERIHVQTARRTMIVVQRSTLEDFAVLQRGAYPQTQVLIATPEDLSEAKRQLFLARIVHNNPEVVIVTHQQFAKIPLRIETQEAWIQEKLDELDEDEGQIDGDSKNKAIKAIERRREKFRRQIDDLEDLYDTGLCFEDLNVDLLIVDEADNYKNLPIYTKMSSVAGLPRSNSGRAKDFDRKRWWIEQTYGSGRIIKMTGTFISNTLAELWKELMDLCPAAMRMRGWHIFDAWAAVCGNIKTGAAIKNTGQIARESRFCEFVNLPEQLQLLHSVADIQNSDTVGIDLNKPKPKFVNVVAPMSDDQREYMNYLVHRSQLCKIREPMIWPKLDHKGNPVMKLERLPDGSEIEVEQEIVDNPLFITTDGRKSVLDYRLIDPEARDYYKSKVNMCVRRVFRLWKRTQEQRSTQIVFCDMGVPNRHKEFCLYYDLRDKWIAMGIPPEEIAIAQEWSTPERRQALHAAVRIGAIRVVIASTEVMGVGTNVQDLLLAIHDLDVRWRPRDMEQRLGRIVRPDNLNTKVLVYRYITQGRDGNVGFDSFMWDRVKIKMRFIRQMFSGNFNLRRIEEDASEDPTFSTAEIVALATGDMRIMAYVELEAELLLNKTLLAGINKEIDQMKHRRYASNVENCIPYLEKEIEYCQRRVAVVEPDISRVLQNRQNCTDEQFQIEILGEVITDPIAAAKKLDELVDQIYLEESNQKEKVKYFTRIVNDVGHYGGFSLRLMVNHQGNYLWLQGAERYECRLLRNVYEAMNRLQQVYLDIADQVRSLELKRKRDEIQLEAVKVELKQREQKRDALEVLIQQQEGDKLALEEELGLNKQEEIETIEFGEEEDE